MAQFVPLKINTEDPSIGKWASKYRSKGKGIPVLYVIRADSEQLYGESGSKPGKELPRFLIEQLQQAGRIFAPRDLATLNDAVAKAKRAMEQNDGAAVSLQIRRIAKFGKPGELRSYAQPAIEADALVNAFVEQGKEQLAASQEQIEMESTRFHGLLELAATSRSYGQLPDLKKPVGVALRDIRKNRQTRDLFTQAMAIDRVHVILAKRRDGKQAAVAALKKIASRDPDSDAAKYAIHWMEQLETQGSSTEEKQP